MARKQVTDMSAWPSLTIEGNLIAPAMVAKLVAFEAAEQSEESYGIRKGLTIREEISLAFRVGQSHFDAFAKLEHPSAEATRRFVRAFLNETFGFADLTDGATQIALIAGGRVPVVVVPPSEALDRRSPTLSTDRSHSPAFSLQDSLNDRDGALWGLVTNGAQLRLMRDNASLTRPAYVEADLAQIFANEDAASFAALWLIIHRSRFGAQGVPATDCALERWREAGSREGETARDRLAAQVEIALRVLGSGFLEVNPELAARLKSGELPLTDWFNELLRLVYRLIFLMVAEDRNLLHPEKADADARKLYAKGYGLAALRAQCVRAASWDRYHDRYEGMKIVFRALAHGETGLALPALGGLFADDRLPSLDHARLRNRAFMEAVYRLSWLADKSGMVPVNWRAMETEELGSVYESLLELQPQLSEDGRELVFASEAAEQKGNQRKTTGSYYTPDSLVQALLNTALDPVLDRTEAEADDPAAALLELSVIDPACGSGHFLLAAARRIATRLARVRAEGTPSLADFRHALRDVARSCIQGVDRNPMAVELTKVALWIETVDPGLPLGFFDVQIRCGDALLGVFDLKALEEGIPDAAYKPLTGDDKPVARHYAQKNRREKAERAKIASGFGFNRQRDLTREFAALRAMPESTLAEIEAKEARLNALTGRDAASYALARACDLYVAAFLSPKLTMPQTAGQDGLPRRGAETVPTSGTVWELLRGVQPFGPLIQEAERALDGARAFHWPLEFPDVMGHGGFDVVLGNPPWERIKLQEQEFFAARSPEIARAPNKAAREKLIKALHAAEEGTPERTLHDAFVAAKRHAEATSEFVHAPGQEGGRFPLTGRGDVNTYALFAELFASLARDHAGVIVPTGIATDATTAPFFAALVEERRLAQLVDFENRAPIFPSVHRSFKFSLLTVGRNEAEARFAFFLTDPAQLAEPERNFTLSPETIARLNPNTKTAPVFRSRADAELTAKIYANAPVLLDENDRDNGNPWHLDIHSRFIHVTEDSSEFRRHDRFTGVGTLDAFNRFQVAGQGKSETLMVGTWLPLQEGEFGWQFDSRFATCDGDGVRQVGIRQHADPNFEPQPTYWVHQTFFDDRLARRNVRSFTHLLAMRRVSSNTNERTVVAAILPFQPVTYGWIMLLTDNERDSVILLGSLNSFVVDYCARNKISQASIPQGTVYQLPILSPSFYTEPRLAFIVPRVLELTYTSHSLAPFARDLGHDGPPFAWDEDRRAQLRAELDAFYARAYGLARDELRYILDPADVKGPDYPSETFRVLKEKEIRQYGEYRTHRLVLAAWDRMEADGIFANLGLGGTPDALAGPAIMVLPPFDGLANGAWTWPASVQPQDRLRYAAQYALWQMDPASDSSRMRFIIAGLAEPALLTPLLAADDRNQWVRLVGPGAQPAVGTVRLRPPINAAWRSMFETLLTSGQIEERADGTWVRGQYFSPAGLQAGSADAQRAAFAIRAVRNMDIGSLTGAVAAEDNVIWARFGSGQSG